MRWISRQDSSKICFFETSQWPSALLFLSCVLISFVCSLLPRFTVCVELQWFVVFVSANTSHCESSRFESSHLCTIACPIIYIPIGNGIGNKMVYAERTHLLDSSSIATDTCSSTSTTIRLCNVHDASPHSHKKRKQQASGKSWLQQAVMSLDPDGIRFAARMSIILSLCTLFVLIQFNNMNFPMGFWVSAIANHISLSVETH